MAQKYMLNIKTNTVYAYHPLTIKRKDMEEISEPQARNILGGRPMMEGLTGQDVINVVPGSAQRGPDVSPAGDTGDKATIAILHRKLGMALKLLGMTSLDQIPDDMAEGGVIVDDLEKGEDLQGPAPIPDNINDDPDIKMLEDIRAAGKGKAKVAAYCLTQFGVTVDMRMRLPELVDQAIGLRKALLADTGGDPRPNAEPETPS